MRVLLTFILLFAFPVSSISRESPPDLPGRFLLVGNLVDDDGYEGYHGAIMEKFDTARDCVFAGKLFIHNYKIAMNNSPDSGRVACVNLNTQDNVEVLYEDRQTLF